MESCLCVNPKCSQSENSGSESVCQACGSSLLLKDRYRVTGVLHEREDKITTVYDVIDVANENTPKVLKVLYTSNEEAIKRFNREADVLITHWVNGLPKVERDGYFSIEFPKNQSPAYGLVMEKIQGIDLGKWLKNPSNKIKDEKQAINWLKQLTSVLGELHNQGFFHRDIKPSNIILRESGERLFLIDLGAVRLITQAILSENTSTTIGTNGYMAPEQFKGKAVPQSDFYALGRTFVHLLTGKHPNQFEDNQRKLVWHSDSVPLSDDFASLIGSLLNQQPEKRPKNTNDILEKLKEIEEKLNKQESKISDFKIGVGLIISLGFLVLFVLAIINIKPIPVVTTTPSNSPTINPTPTSSNSPTTTPTGNSNCQTTKNGELNVNALALDAQKAINKAKLNSNYPNIQKYSNKIFDPKQFGCTVKVEILRKQDEIIIPELQKELEAVIRESVNPKIKDMIGVDIQPRYIN